MNNWKVRTWRLTCPHSHKHKKRCACSCWLTPIFSFSRGITNLLHRLRSILLNYPNLMVLFLKSPKSPRLKPKGKYSVVARKLSREQSKLDNYLDSNHCIAQYKFISTLKDYQEWRYAKWSKASIRSSGSRIRRSQRRFVILTSHNGSIAKSSSPVATSWGFSSCL